jgi:hypothetical protein
LALRHVAPTLTLTLTLRVAGRVALRTAPANRLRPRAHCSQACRLGLELTLDAPAARRLGLTRGTRAVTIAKATSTLTTAGTRRLALRLSAPSARVRLRWFPAAGCSDIR